MARAGVRADLPLRILPPPPPELPCGRSGVLLPLCPLGPAAPPGSVPPRPTFATEPSTTRRLTHPLLTSCLSVLRRLEHLSTANYTNPGFAPGKYPSLFAPDPTPGRGRRQPSPVSLRRRADSIASVSSIQPWNRHGSRPGIVKEPVIGSDPTSMARSRRAGVMLTTSASRVDAFSAPGCNPRISTTVSDALDYGA
jgi:hypothetical protein